jgi:hypothetical protein
LKIPYIVCTTGNKASTTKCSLETLSKQVIECGEQIK